MITTGNIGIDIFGQPVRVVREASSSLPGVGRAQAVRELLDAKAGTQPGVPESLRSEVGGDRWDNHRTFFVGKTETSGPGDITEIIFDDQTFNVALISDWGEYLVVVGRRQGQ